MEDFEIVQLYWDRDQSAITYTASKYGRYCTSIAINILGSMEDAEECVNDTYMNAWNAMPPHRPNALSTFIGKITRNLSFNRYRHKHADKRGGSEIAAVLEELSECVSGKSNVEQDMEYQELVETINTFLDALSPKKRSIFICRYWHTDSVSDIAKRFDMKENAVSMTLGRLRRKLHKYLTERGYEL